jgi:bla regulator protein blaR1
MKDACALHHLAFSRRVLLALACAAAGLIPAAICARPAQAQAASQTPAANQDITGTWQGTLHLPQRDLRTVVKVAKDAKDAVQVTMYSIDQGGQGIQATSASFQDGELKYAVQFIDGDFDGKLSGDHNSIDGMWHQGQSSLPLLLVRATPATEWTIPPPTPRMAPMAANANPNFEVATIKPSKPDQPGKLFGVRGDRIMTINTTLSDLITFAYSLQAKQIIGGPDWIKTEKFDINGQPDIPGQPNTQQLRSMFQKLMADRFQLKFHKETREMPAYVLTVAKNGPKMTKSTADANALPSLLFRGLGVLPVQNATMDDFCHVMQAAVLDRPVVDQTGLIGRWNFLLKWTPDESQFDGMGIKVPPPSDAVDAPPPLFTAIQDQIGLKLEAGKAQVEVLVLDHVEQPSAN